MVFSLELPKNSLVMQEIGRREFGDEVRWGDTEYLQMATANSIRDLLFFHNMCRYMDGGKKGQKPKPPEPIHPPGWTPPKPVFTKQADAIAIMASWKG